MVRKNSSRMKNDIGRSKRKISSLGPGATKSRMKFDAVFKLKKKNNLPALISSAKKKDAFTRLASFQAILELRKKDAVHCLKELLKSKDKLVVWEAISNSERLGDVGLLDALNKVRSRGGYLSTFSDQAIKRINLKNKK